jgi:hypothetical protein
LQSCAYTVILAADTFTLFLVLSLLQAGGMWVTELLQKMWPQATVAAEAAVQDAFPDIVGQLGMPTWMEGIEVRRSSGSKNQSIVYTISRCFFM